MRIRLLQCMTLVMLLLSCGSAFAQTPPASLAQWEYRWGDSPRAENDKPSWLHDNSTAWKPIDFPSNPPSRLDQNGQRSSLWSKRR
jgi:hypothetical protein